ncbi:MAG: 50S ribosomal protein L15 [Deltaproteobacteria bacterium]|nr:50S ribosomal protein L15 [Deltaproteobacteria bacterium]
MEIGLGNFPSFPGTRFKRKRLGRGDASGQGSTSGKGHKGQKARAGGYHKVGFEGGQMPLSRRVPKRGFTNIFRKEFAIVNLGDFDKIPANTVVDAQFLKKEGKIRKNSAKLKVLGGGELKKKLTIRADSFSASARKKIATAGGKAETIQGTNG